MRYIFKDLEKLKEILRGKYLFLFLDCDGTLVPIRDTPDKVVIPQQTKNLLISLSRKKNCKVAIISGRSLSDIKKKFGIKGIIYSGNHGFQIEGPGIRCVQFIPAGYKKALSCIKTRLESGVDGIKGVFLEDKGLSLALHFRLADKKKLPFIASIFRRAILLCSSKCKATIKRGKKVLEVMPPVSWDKGKIVIWLLAKQEAVLRRKNILPVYIGDDLTDEDAFKALKGKGLTVFVGKPRRSRARYYLRDTGEVGRLLRLISSLENS
jgi:trehalose-phosphatase